MPDDLARQYAELKEVDAALRQAEQKLQEAHRKFAGQQGPRPDGLYREVTALRERARALLEKLGDSLSGD
jgi:FtsZ-binding cell division protein ZapB